jgi:hypothetical protein
MSPRSVRTVRGALLKKGFVPIKDGDHQAFQLCVDGERVGIRTYYSHGARECDDYILGLMSRQLLLSRSQLNDLIDCKMTGEDYVGLLKDRGDL